MKGDAIRDVGEEREARLDGLRREIDIGLEGESGPWDVNEIRAEARRRKLGREAARGRGEGRQR